MSFTRRGVLSGSAALLAGCAWRGKGDTVLHRVYFDYGMGQWLVEAEQPGRIDLLPRAKAPGRFQQNDD